MWVSKISRKFAEKSVRKGRGPTTRIVGPPGRKESNGRQQWTPLLLHYSGFRIFVKWLIVP